MKLLIFLLRQSRWIVGTSILTGAISGGANTLLIVLVHDIIDKQGPHRPASVAVAFLALCIGLPLTRLISEVLLAYLAQKAIFDLRLHMCRRILQVPLRELEQVGAPRLLASLTDDIGSITNTLLAIPMVTIQLAVVLGCLIYMGWLSLPLTLAVIGFIAVGSFSWQYVVRKADGMLRAAREQQNDLYSHFRAVTDGVKELKLHRPRRLAFMDDLLHGTASRYQRYNVAARAFFAGGGAFLQLLYFGAFGLLLLVLPEYTRVDRTVMTGFILVLLYLLAPLDFLIGMASDVGRSVVALRQVEELGLALASHASEAEDVAGPAALAPPAPWRQLELVGITHTYHREREDSRFLLGPVTAAFEGGELIFVTGGNGSGKTTLGKLISGLYVPEDGCIRLDGVPISAANREHYRSLFSAVFSDFYLFDRMLGFDAADADARTLEYLEKLQLARKVEIKGGKLSTIELSQGQRKRLALLTAYLEDRPIYLFDEWAADQDPEFKHIFYYALLPELKARGKTVFVITHDDSYFHLADRILKLQDGRLETPAPPEPGMQSAVVLAGAPAA